MHKILLFIPTYNCEKQIERVLEKVQKNEDFFERIIIVDNISTDNTLKVVKNFLKNASDKYKLFQNCKNYGLGGSHKIAFKYAIENNFNYVIVLHGDDQADINDIIPILKNKEYEGYDCVLGARFMKNSVLKGYSKFRIFGNKVYNKLFSIVVKNKVYDLGSGLNMYEVTSLKNKYYEKYPDNLVFNYCLILAIDFYKQNIKYFPISWREEDQVSNVKMFNQAIKVLKLLIEYRINKNKFINKELRENVIEDYLFEELKYE